MKYFSFVSLKGVIFMAMVSWNNQNNTASSKTDSTKTKAVVMNGDTSKFTLSMVDNKNDFVCRMPLTAIILYRSVRISSDIKEAYS